MTNWFEARTEADKVASKAQGVHEAGLDAIIVRLEKSGNYSQVYKELEYNNSLTRQSGEIDVLAQHRNGSWFIFEYKCHDHPNRRKKGLDQLDKAERYIFWEEKTDRVYKYYVYEDMIYKMIK